MPMIPFMERFPDLAARETRSVTVSGRIDIPDGEYGFLESFCDEPGCDCRRVMIVVLRSDTELNKIWASINYGWESVEFYKRWGGSWVTAPNSQGPFLDPPESSDSVFGGAAESVSFLAAITRVRSADTDSLPYLSPDCR
jgi:hypothetical protein